jgi:hypothetical protein
VEGVGHQGIAFGVWACVLGIVLGSVLGDLRPNPIKIPYLNGLEIGIFGITH